MSTPTSIVVQQCNYWMRVILSLELCVKQALISILHNYQLDNSYIGLDDDENALYQSMINFKTQYEHALKKVIKGTQWDILCPATGKSNAKDWDITLIVIVIRYTINLPPPLGGWKQITPNIRDQSLAAFCLLARNLRNKINHGSISKLLTQAQFLSYWAELEFILLGLHYDNMQLFNDLETGSLKLYTSQILNALENHLSILDDHINDIEKTKIDVNEKNIDDNTNAIDDLRNDMHTVQCLSHQIRVDLNENDKRLKMLEKQSNTLEKQSEEHNRHISALQRERMTEFSNDYVLPEVLKLVCELINDKWSELAIFLGINETAIEEIKLENTNTSISMEKCFKIVPNEIMWKDLKMQLSKCGSVGLDLIEVLKTKTLLTSGIQCASFSLKANYRKELQIWNIAQPFRRTDGEDYVCLPRDEAYVDLAVIKAADMEKDWGNNSDREFFMKTQHFEKERIELEDIIKDDEKFVIVRGIAGIGKSTMVDMYVLKWSQYQFPINQSDGADVDFIFKLTCRELNISDNIGSVQAILKEKYPYIFDTMSMADLRDVSNHVILLIDGIDELRDIHTLHTQQQLPLVKTVGELLNPLSNEFPFHKTIVAARPEACAIVQRAFNRARIKLVEVCGFSPDNVQKYIQKFYKNEGEKIDQVQAKIDESDNLKVMSTIPIYIWIICGIFQEDMSIEAPKTTTHLCAYACLLFLRNHLRQYSILPSENNTTIGEDIKDLPLESIIDREDILDIINCLSKLSKSMLKERKVVFTEKEVKLFHSSIDLRTGFLCKYQSGERKALYQFRHLVLQEFFCSMHIYFHSKNPNEELKKSCFTSCIPIVAGINGIEISRSDTDLIKIFMNNMKQFAQNKLDKSTGSFLKKTKKKFDVNKLVEIMLKHQTGDLYLDIDESCSNVLSSVFEYQHELSDKNKQLLRKMPISIQRLMFHHDIRNISHCLSTNKARNVREIILYCLEDKTFPENVYKLFQLFFDDLPNACKTLVLNKKRQVSIVAKTIRKVGYPSTKEIIFTLQNENSVAKHKNLLETLFGMVDEIRVDFNIDNLYPSITNILPNFIRRMTFSSLRDFLLQKSNDGNSFFQKCLSEEELLMVLHALISPDRIYELDMSGSKLSMASTSCIAESVVGSNDSEMLYPVTILDLKDCALTDSHIEKLKPSLKYLRALKLDKNTHLSSLSIKVLAESLSNDALFMSFCSCSLTEAHVLQLEPCLQHLEELYLNENKGITPKSIQMLLQADSTLKYLHLYDCGLTDAHLQCFDKTDHNIILLDVSLNKKLSPKVMNVIQHSVMEKVKNNRENHLKILRISDCNIDISHIEMLKPCIPYLTELTLSYNLTLHSRCTRLITESLISMSRTVELVKPFVLRLSSCNLSDAHIKNLQPCFKYLFALDVSCIQLDVEKVQLIAKCIVSSANESQSSTLKNLLMKECGLKDSHIKVLQPCIAYLVRLDLSLNENISPTSMKRICEAVLTEPNNKLKYFCIADCKLSEDHLKHLVLFMHALEQLDLSGNQLKVSSMLHINSAITEFKDQSCLQKLCLERCNLTDDHIEKLLPSFSILERIKLVDNPKLSRRYISSIPDNTFSNIVDLPQWYADVFSSQSVHGDVYNRLYFDDGYCV